MILFFGRFGNALTASYHPTLLNVSGYGNAIVKGNNDTINFTVIVISSHLVNSKLDTLHNLFESLLIIGLRGRIFFRRLTYSKAMGR